MKRIFKYVWKYSFFVVFPFILMTIGIGLDMQNPVLQKIMVDDVVSKGNLKMLGMVLFGIGGITIARAIIGYIKEYMFDYASSRISIDLKRELFNHILKLPFSYFDNMNTGELMSRINGDVDNIWRSVSFGVRLLVENAIYFVIATVIIFRISWKLAILSYITMPIIAYLALKVEKKVGDIYGQISDQSAVINTAAQEDIAGVRLVKAFSREKHEILKFLNMNKENYKLNIELNQAFGKYFSLIDFLCNLTMIIVIAVGGVFVINHNFTIGTLVEFNAYVSMMIFPMRQIGWLMSMIAQSKASAGKIFNILDTKPLIADKANAAEAHVNGTIDFSNVSFKYNSEYVLKNINLHVPAGKTVAIMGGTGSGKTSIINLIGRYYDVTEGKVLIDGTDVKDLKLQSFRKDMSVVQQDTFLFSDTIVSNIMLGKDGSTLEDVRNICKTCCIDDFIMGLEDQYDTVVGERGIGLSGGQKQRISISRALIGDYKILILDDATSALDMETEYELLKNLYHKEKKATTFIIAHRISAVKNADIIIFMDKGEIVEQGTHEELLQKKGKYYEVYCEQFKDFAVGEEAAV